METNILIRHMRGLPPEALFEVARSYKHFARDLEREARRKQKSRKEMHNWKYRLDTLHGIPEAVQYHIEAGFDRDDAIRKVALDRRHTIRNVENLMRQHDAKKRRAIIETRDLKIIEYKKRGYSNCTIASKVGLSRSQISRILKRYLMRFE